MWNHSCLCVFVYLCVVLGFEPRSFCMQGRCSIVELFLQPFLLWFWFSNPWCLILLSTSARLCSVCYDGSMWGCTKVLHILHLVPDYVLIPWSGESATFIAVWGIVTGHVVIESYKEGEQHAPCVGKDGISQLRLPLEPRQCCLHTTQSRWHALIFLFPKSCMVLTVSFWPVIHLDLILCIRREVRMLLRWFVRLFSCGSTLAFPCSTELQLAINTSVWTLFCPILGQGTVL